MKYFRKVLDTKFGKYATGFLTSMALLLNVGCGRYEKFSELADFNGDFLKDKAYVEASRFAPFGSKYDDIFLQICNPDGTFGEPKIIKRVKGRIFYFDTIDVDGINHLAVAFPEINKDKRYVLKNNGRGEFKAIDISETL